MTTTETKTFREMGRSLKAQGWTPAQVAALIRQRKLSAGQALELTMGYGEAV